MAQLAGVLITRDQALHSLLLPFLDARTLSCIPQLCRLARTRVQLALCCADGIADSLCLYYGALDTLISNMSLYRSLSFSLLTALSVWPSRQQYTLMNLASRRPPSIHPVRLVYRDPSFPFSGTDVG